EALPQELVDRWAPGRRMYNAYGPTEASVYATISECRAGEGRPTIGRPVVNAEAYVLDARLEPVPVGVPGELYLGGIGLARGYAGRPELTAERFVPHPFARVPGARLYRTGDRVRWLPDGRLDYLGRLDEQVKLRGIRIEPGEIEAVLRLHPGVERAVVMLREDVPGIRQLVAYVVPSGHPAPTVAALRAFARERLPEAMVPFAFVTLKALPTLPSGKLDRRALPPPERPAATGGEANAPLTPVEETLASIWKDVLRVEQVRREDQFFELGGDSILALQVVARANQAGLGLTARDVFRSPTLSGLAEVAGSAPPPAEQGPVTGPVPLTPIQHWFFERSLEGAHHWNQSVLLELKEPLEMEPLAVALGKLLEHHDALRLRFRRGRDGWEQHGVAPDGQVPLSRIDLSALPDAEVPPALERHTTELQGSLGLEEGPLVRVALFDLGPGRSGRLFITIHHLAVDGVSWRILLEDLLAAYAQAARGGVPGLPPKTTSFRRWAERLSGFARSAELESEWAYWLAQPWAKAGRLPREFDGRNLTGDARSTRVSLTLEESRGLSEKVARHHRAGLDEALLAALARVTRDWVAGALLVDVEGHGREDVLDGVDVSRTVGWFTSSYPVLLELPRGAGATEALRATRDVLRRVPRRGIGFGLLRYLAEPEKAEALARLPRAEMSFNYLGRFDSIPTAGRIAVAPERQGPDHHPAAARSHLVDITAQVLGGRLEVVWTYGGDVFREATIDALARRHLDALRELVSGSTAEQHVKAKPEDFPLAKVNQKQLDALGKRFGRKKE
ncbi:MAG TPA: condensation domain-containing protein, partial [Longimicrobium sp.]|nr:condensation domain-containing protein [Longimicrobium sp.]